jgi:hypothetical protein
VNPVSTTAWTRIGWLSVGLVVLAVPLSLIDGVISAFALYAAIIAGGLSSVGLESTARFGVATIVLSLLLGTIATHYTSSTGFLPPDLSRVLAAISILGIPSLASLTLIITGVLRRKRAKSGHRPNSS